MEVSLVLFPFNLHSALLTALHVTRHPQSTACTKDEGVELSVSAIGAEPLQYQWKKDGAVITDLECTGVTTQILTIHTFSQNHEGNYSCIVSNSLQSVESKTAHLALGVLATLMLLNFAYAIK